MAGLRNHLLFLCHRNAVMSVYLCAVERSVSFSYKLGITRSIEKCGRHSDGNCLSRAIRGLHIEIVLQFIEEKENFLSFGIALENDTELITADPVYGSISGKTVINALFDVFSCFDQDTVAFVTSEIRVDVEEIIRIHKRDHNGLSAFFAVSGEDFGQIGLKLLSGRKSKCIINCSALLLVVESVQMHMIFNGNGMHSFFFGCLLCHMSLL